MIEDYGTLSQEELREEILQELEDNAEVDTSDLKLNFEGKKLFINGTLQNEEELENLIGVLENYLEPEEFELEIDLIEGHAISGYDDEDTGGSSGKGMDSDLDGMEEDMDFIDEEDMDDEW